MANSLRRLAPLLLALAAARAPADARPADARPAADLIVHHARIWTVDEARPEAEALAVLGERLVAVGSDAEVRAWQGAKTRVIDAGGRRVLPGFNDAHVHFRDGGAALAAVQLNDAPSEAEMVRRIAARAKTLAPGEWVLAGNWDETKWSPAQLPTRTLLDPATGAVPVWVDRYDGHAVLANSAALKLAGISAATPDPPGGVIVRDARGEPTGVLKDAAADLLNHAIPAPTAAERREDVRRALAHAASLGVTSVQNMDNGDASLTADIATFAELLESGELSVRIYVAPLIAGVEDQARLGLRHAFGGPWLRLGAVKAYADGSLGSATAYFYEPFLDKPGERGLLSEGMQPISRMRERMLRADSAGIQICTHAIGDAGIATILDLYQDVATANGLRDRRWRIEHAQHMAAADFTRFRALGVIASVQPYHAIDDGRWAEARIGHDRASRTYAFRSFLEHGVRLAFGTDWPVAPLNPMLSLYAASTRATLDGKHPGGWFPEQKLTVREAIAAYTMGSAYAEFQDAIKGSLTPGKLADFVVLEADPLAVAPEAIRDIRVHETWVGGRRVYAATAH
jgi:predicted amidohydrolase YtcJ